MLSQDFDSANLPAARRLPTFQAAAYDFQVDAVGDPADFSVRWRLLALGDVNAIHSFISPLHYRRDRALIQADGSDRVTIHYYLSGGSIGMLDGKHAEVGPGGAMVWDLARSIDVKSTGPSELIILTLPRHMLIEVLPADVFSGVLPPTPELAVAGGQARYMIDNAQTLSDDAAPFFARALRDLFAVAMLPVFRPDAADDAGAPLFRRICDLIDADLRSDIDVIGLAAALGVTAQDVRDALTHLGNLDVLRERRRMLAAYRLLGDPDETASISAIAWRCGFDDLPRFSRRFREVFDIQPSLSRRHLGGHLPRWAGAYHVVSNYGALMDGAAVATPPAQDQRDR